MKGYIEHELQNCLEIANLYVLLVKWETLEVHTIGFRGSEEYREWKNCIIISMILTDSAAFLEILNSQALDSR